MSNAFGIPLTMEDFSNYKTSDYVGAMFKYYPNGTIPITGLSNMFTTEPLNGNEVNVYEEWYQEAETTTRGTNPLTSDAPSTGDADDGTQANGAITTSTALYLKVATVDYFREGQIISIAGQSDDLQFIIGDDPTVGAADKSLKGYVKIYAREAFTYSAADFTAGARVEVIGSAVANGSYTSVLKPVSMSLPINRKNYRQRFHEPIWYDALDARESLKWDKDGFLKKLKREALIRAAIDIEKAVLFSKRSSAKTIDPYDSTSKINYTMSGIEQELQIWDAGSTGVTIDGSTYAPYSWRTAATSDTDVDKRVIQNAGGTISYRSLMEYIERVHYYRDKSSNEFMVICGNGALIALTEMFRKETQFQVTVKDNVYGLSCTRVNTQFGDLILKSHPLFNNKTARRYWMMVLDIPSIKIAYAPGYKLRFEGDMAKDEVFIRKSGWTSALTLKMKNVRSNMLIKNVRNYIAE